jgi:hypothetical protein
MAKKPSKEKPSESVDKGGRPRNEVDLNKLAALMRMKPSLEDTAAFFQVSSRTIERLIKSNFGVGFVEFRQQNMVVTRHAIIRKIIEKALRGDNTMLIWSSKNLCDWSDNNRSNEDDSPSKSITLNYSVGKK